MAAGTFNKQVGKVRPGTYVNKESTKQNAVLLSARGTVLLPLLLNWGPVKEAFTITNAAPDGQYANLGYSIYDDDPNGQMLLIREAFKLASKVICYRLTGGEKAKVTTNGLTATAKYGGTRGNALRVAIIENPVGGFDVSLYLDGTVVFEAEGIATIGDLVALDNNFVVWSGTSGTALVAVAGVALAGGTDTALVNLDVTTFLDDSEVLDWNAVAFPFTDSTLIAALKSKINYLRNDVGKKRTAAVPSYAANCEGIDSIDNGVVLSNGTKLSATQCTAWVAAAAAAATNVESNTYLAYEDAVDVNGKKTQEQATAAINSGKMFFSSVNGAVVLEYDINTLTDFNAPSSKDYRKNRVRRVLDTFDEALQLNFPPNKFDNAKAGWDLMESLGRQLLTSFSDAGAITEVNLDKDFLVDRSASTGDETYLNIGLKAVDAAEKLFFTVRTR